MTVGASREDLLTASKLGEINICFTMFSCGQPYTAEPSSGMQSSMTDLNGTEIPQTASTF
jgi:hypothetical protein